MICTLNSIDSATVAAWVQALGALAALWIAIWISNNQHKIDLKNDRRRTKEIAIRRLAVAISLGGAVIEKIKTLKTWANSSNPEQHIVNIDFLLAQVKSLKDDIATINLNDVDDFESLKIISNMKTFASISVSIIEHVTRIRQSHAHWSKAAISELDRMIPEFEVEMKDAVALEVNLKNNLKFYE